MKDVETRSSQCEGESVKNVEMRYIASVRKRCVTVGIARVKDEVCVSSSASDRSVKYEV